MAFLKLLSTLVREPCKQLLSYQRLSYQLYLTLHSDRRLLRRVLRRFLIYFIAKLSAQLDGAHCLIVYLYMRISLNSPFKLLEQYCQSFRRGMQKHLLHILMFFKRYWEYPLFLWLGFVQSRYFKMMALSYRIFYLLCQSLLCISSMCMLKRSSVFATLLPLSCSSLKLKKKTVGFIWYYVGFVSLIYFLVVDKYIKILT